LGSETNWAKVSAIAAACGVGIAFLAYAAPHSPAGSVPPPALFTTGPVLLPEGGATSALATTPAPTPPSGPPWSMAPLPDAACANGLPIVDTYYKAAGTTIYTREAAARQAAQDMMPLAGHLDGRGPGDSDIIALYNDFSRIQIDLEGGHGQNYSSFQAQTDADAATLRRVCGGS
jgi:hypothetical protein